MIRLARRLVLLSALAAALGFAAVPAAFRFERDVVPGGPGPNRLEVDLDPRVRTKPYGRLFLASLPDCRQVVEKVQE